MLPAKCGQPIVQSLKVFQHFILAIILSERVMSLLLEYPSHFYFS